MIVQGAPKQKCEQKSVTSLTRGHDQYHGEVAPERSRIALHIRDGNLLGPGSYWWMLLDGKGQEGWTAFGATAGGSPQPPVTRT
jgi:hypothetical protein